ncbi:nucleotidyltransferase domain-containing protein [Candidatus Poribacteria bacterium]|nr:nucleotidyltransferase domain-containing protein [Candidatus Poribacteria bacterium]
MHNRKEYDERRDRAETAAQECVHMLKEKFDVREAFVFGSLRGDSPWHERSDIDIAVVGLPPQEYWHALLELERLLPPRMELDLITLEDAPPRLVARAKQEVMMPEEPKERLKVQIEDEFANIERVIELAERFLAEVSEQPNEVELGGLGKFVHDFYTAVERIFERIAVWLGEAMPSGERWHIEFLEQMQREVKGRHPAVVDDVLAARLLEYLRFRHRFRHTYGYELKWDKLRPLVEGLSETQMALREQVSNFLALLTLTETEQVSEGEAN